MYCLNCNSLIKSKNKYYSNKCQQEYKYTKYINEWKNGLKSGMRGDYQISMYIKTYLFKKFNYKCSKCGWSKTNPFTGNIPLEIDHIDGNYKNNNEDNLILLCPNCHSLTETYKGANLNHGRNNRHKYYQKKENFSE